MNHTISHRVVNRITERWSNRRMSSACGLREAIDGAVRDALQEMQATLPAHTSERIVNAHNSAAHPFDDWNKATTRRAIRAAVREAESGVKAARDAGEGAA